MRAMIAASRAEAGCLACSQAEDVLEPGLMRETELWDTRGHLNKHSGADHIATRREQRGQLQISERLKLYNVDAGEPA